MGKGSFDERRSMRKRIYDKEREWLKRETTKQGMLGTRTSLDERATGARKRQDTIYLIL